MKVYIYLYLWGNLGLKRLNFNLKRASGVMIMMMMMMMTSDEEVHPEIANRRHSLHAFVRIDYSVQVSWWAAENRIPVAEPHTHTRQDKIIIDALVPCRSTQHKLNEDALVEERPGKGYSHAPFALLTRQPRNSGASICGAFSPSSIPRKPLKSWKLGTRFLVLQ